MTYPKTTLRLFSATDGPRIAGWIADPAYETYFRNMSVIPTIEECANYPAWTQNVIMMVLLDGEPIGMATAYYINYRNKTVRLGMLIDKAFQGNGCGHSAMSQWIDRWFKNGFRKISVDNIDEHFTEPYLKVGFFVEGRFAKQCLVGGEYKDEIVMSCFLEDWKG